MTNAQKLARDLALDVLKAYNAKIFQSVATPEQRERAQAAAYVAAETRVRNIVIAHVTDMYYKDSWTKIRKGFDPIADAKFWLDEKAKDEP